jgi:drug/metabolite transporter (DMT)-like permease
VSDVLVEGATLSRRRFGSTELFLLSTVLFWGVNFAVVKYALRFFSPLAFNAVRFGLATVIMLFVLILRREDWRLSSRDLVGMVLLGLSGHTAYQYFFINGVANTSPSSSSLILATAPIFVAIYSHCLGIDRARRIVWIGIALSFVGMLLLVLGKGAAGGAAGGSLKGDLLMVGAAMLWASYVTGSRPLLLHHSPIKVTALSMLAGIPPFIAISWSELTGQAWAQVPPEAWACLFYSAFLAICVGYIFWAIGVQRVGSIRTGAYQNAVPVVAVVVSWVFLRDALQPLQILGAAIVLFGIILTRRRPA